MDITTESQLDKVLSEPDGALVDDLADCGEEMQYHRDPGAGGIAVTVPYAYVGRRRWDRRNGMSWAADYLTSDVLPWWDRHGADDTVGGIWSCVSDAGVRRTSDKFTWSQGRWAWMCAELVREATEGGLDIDPAPWPRQLLRSP